QDGLVPPEHEIAKRVLILRGVPESAVIILPPECDSTFDEARALADFLDHEPHSTVAIVTAVEHTRRSRWIFSRVLGEKAARLRYAGVPNDGFNESNWWRFEKGLRIYSTEYVKLAFYMIHY